MRAVMGRHERFRSELSTGFKVEKNKANLDWKRALECLDRKGDVSLAEHEHTAGSCIGRSRNSRKASSAAASDKQPPQQKSPYIEN